MFGARRELLQEHVCTTHMIKPCTPLFVTFLFMCNSLLWSEQILPWKTKCTYKASWWCSVYNVIMYNPLLFSGFTLIWTVQKILNCLLHVVQAKFVVINDKPKRLIFTYFKITSIKWVCKDTVIGTMVGSLMYVPEWEFGLQHYSRHVKGKDLSLDRFCLEKTVR